MIDNTANVLDGLYAGFEVAPEGEDYILSWSEREMLYCARGAEHWAEINAARVGENAPSWDGLILEAAFAANAETDPNLRTDRLLELAAIALTAGASVQRQVAQIEEAAGYAEIAADEVE